MEEERECKSLEDYIIWGSKLMTALGRCWAFYSTRLDSESQSQTKQEPPRCPVTSSRPVAGKGEGGLVSQPDPHNGLRDLTTPKGGGRTNSSGKKKFTQQTNLHAEIRMYI